MSNEVVARALGYPYPREPGAFVWRDGHVARFAGTLPGGSLACVAYGSNASPQQLTRKFGDLRGIEIPTIPAELLDHDVVYAPWISFYGSIPATLAASPGTRARVWLQWLSPGALLRMDETEGVPEVYGRTAGLTVILEDGTHVDAFSYVAAEGVLLVDGKPVALAEIPASGRSFAMLSQRDAQESVRELLGVRTSVEKFIGENVADPELRNRRSDLLPRERPSDRVPT